jgi:hypothetical protein
MHRSAHTAMAVVWKRSRNTFHESGSAHESGFEGVARLAEFVVGLASMTG